MFQLAFDPLQGIVDGLDVPVQLTGHLVVGFAVEIGCQDLPFQIAEDLIHLQFDIIEFFAADDQLFGIADADAGQDVLQRPVRFVFIDGLVEGHI